jgi:hypothetical protein
VERQKDGNTKRWTGNKTERWYYARQIGERWRRKRLKKGPMEERLKEALRKQ